MLLYKSLGRQLKMIRINEYEDYILRPTPLDNTEINQVADFERLVLLAKMYDEDITSEAVDELKASYEQKITEITLLPNKNQNTIEALKRNAAMNAQLDQINQAKTNDNLTLTRTNNQSGFSAGFTNASIIIFIVMLVGIIASVLLLSVS